MKLVLSLVLLFAIGLHAKDVPTKILWPSDEHPVVRFTFGKFAKLNSVGSESAYMVEVTAENL